jgi:predicted transcriptional regulator
MAIQLDKSIRTLFGSGTRANVLAVLANSYEPKTAYAISKEIETKPAGVYREVRNLAAAGLLEVRYTSTGTKEYYLADGDLRRLLLRRARIAALEDWFSPARVQEVRNAIQRANRLNVELPIVKPNRSRVSNKEEYERSPAKDRALRKIAAHG